LKTEVFPTFGLPAIATSAARSPLSLVAAISSGGVDQDLVGLFHTDAQMAASALDLYEVTHGDATDEPHLCPRQQPELHQAAPEAARAVQRTESPGHSGAELAERAHALRGPY